MPSFKGFHVSGYAVGEFVKLAHNTLPFGVLACDGTQVAVSDFLSLYNKIGTTYNLSTDTDPTKFRLPNPQGRAMIGDGTYNDAVSGPVTRVLGTSIGTESHTLSVAQMPSHRHDGPGVSGAASGPSFSGHGVPSFETGPSFYGDYTGSGQAHNNMQPSLVVKYGIAYI